MEVHRHVACSFTSPRPWSSFWAGGGCSRPAGSRGSDSRGRTNGLTLSTAVAGDTAEGGDLSTDTIGARPERSTTTTRRIYVQVVGAVVHPGVYPLSAGARTFDAIAAAGGVTGEGDDQALPLAALVGDGARVVVPTKGQASGAGSGSGAPEGGGGGVSGGSPAVAPLSLSDATAEQLDALPGIGPATAQQIVSYRDAHGPFASVAQLDEVSGIGPATLARLEGLVVP